MHLNVCLFLGALTLLVACSSQNAPRNVPPAPTVTMSVGDTVKTLGNNIMTVYQDKNNHYWFASWQDGLYKYDGKTILHFTTKHGLPHHRVEDVQEDIQGHIYLNTSAGVCKFNGSLKNQAAIRPN